MLDHHGAGDFVPAAAAIKVPIASPEQLTVDLVAALRVLARIRSGGADMGKAGREFAEQHRWPEEARAMRRIYDRIQRDSDGER